MRIVVIGAGAVGYHLAQRLSTEGQDVVVVEQSAERAERVAQQLDVLAITGNGAAVPVLHEAGLAEADLLLAVSGSDEVNLVACFAASRLGVPVKVARISTPEYYPAGSVLSREELGVDLMINPERECAWETVQLLRSEAATDLARFADGRVALIGLRVTEDAPLAGKSLARIDRELKRRQYITAAIVRDGRTEIPTGRSRIEAGDRIYVLAPATDVPTISRLAGYERSVLRHVMVAGGSEEAYHLARYLEELDVDCTILEADRERCVELAEALPKALVLHADASDLELLEMEGVAEADGFVAFTHHDDTNMLACLLAKTSGARRTISLVDRIEYIPLVERVGIDASVSPRLSTANAILRYVRRGNVLSVATVKGVDAEALELDIAATAPIVGRPLRDVDFPEGGLLGLIVRDDRVIIPRGDDIVEAGDNVIVFALPGSIPAIERLFE
ncbi:MAG: Trk system potassium transporter TrkA [Gemmatimonadota bacterium]